MSVDKFRISEITATHLNGVPFEKFDMKDRDQHLSGAAYIQEMIIDGHVGVMGSVNGLKLKPEKKNSLLVRVILICEFPLSSTITTTLSFLRHSPQQCRSSRLGRHSTT